MTLDPFAAQLWAHEPGAPVYWLSEPPLGANHIDDTQPRSIDITVFGALARRKGLSRLTRAIRERALHISVLVAGWIEQEGYETEIGFEVEAMRRAGAEERLALHFHSEPETLAVLARSRCVVLPYLRHFGMSRVLLEACSVGTPVITHDFGLLGYLTRVHQLGVSVDCEQPGAMALAIDELTKARGARFYTEQCLKFAVGFSKSRFQETVHAAVCKERVGSIAVC
jgi:glycosyltransferase involved in cell wall biosynthesis